MILINDVISIGRVVYNGYTTLHFSEMLEIDRADLIENLGKKGLTNLLNHLLDYKFNNKEEIKYRFNVEQEITFNLKDLLKTIFDWLLNKEFNFLKEEVEELRLEKELLINSILKIRELTNEEVQNYPTWNDSELV